MVRVQQVQRKRTRHVFIRQIRITQKNINNFTKTFIVNTDNCYPVRYGHAHVDILSSKEHPFNTLLEEFFRLNLLWNQFLPLVHPPSATFFIFHINVFLNENSNNTSAHFSFSETLQGQYKTLETI